MSPYTFGHRTKDMSHINFNAMKNPVRQNSLAIVKYVFLFTLITTLYNVSAEIKNGYENEINQLTESLNNLRAILNQNNDLDGSKRRNIVAKIASIENTISYHALTESLLRQFKAIAPDLYAEIDTIKDNKGRSVNVYVKFIPKDATEVKAWGTTYIAQGENDHDAYQSEYGELTVSVKIWIVNQALLVLSHELGHVKYQVPHLASYVEYHKKHYKAIVSSDSYIGHRADDPSGNNAAQYEKRFRKEYANYLKVTDEKIQSPVALMDKIRKQMNNEI